MVATSNTCTSTNQIAAIQCVREASKVIAETSTKDFVAISRDLLGILAQQSIPAEVHRAVWLRVARSAQIASLLPDRLHFHASTACQRCCL